MFKRLLLVLLVGVASISLGSGFFWLNGRPSESDIEGLFDSSKSSPSETPSILDQVQIFLDGSGSMTGFIKSGTDRIGNTSYCNVLRALDSYLRGKAENVVYHKFGEEVVPIVNCDTAIRNPSFYSDQDTRLAQLISNLSREDSENLPRAFLIVTDGIQSTPDSEDYKEIISGLSNWLSRGFYFEILAFRSQFHGKVYSELQGGKFLGSYNSDDYGKRPFYVYILSPVKDYGKQLVSGLHSYPEVSFGPYINLTPELFDSPEIGFEVPDHDNPLCGYYTTPTIKYLSWKKRRETSLIGNFRTIIYPRLKEDQHFVVTEQGITCDGETRIFESNEKLPFSDLSLVKVSAKKRGDLTALVCDFTLKEQKNGKWVIYRVILKPGDGTIRPPQWVRDFSSRTDFALEDFSKTLYFQEFITSIMLNPAFQKEALAVFYLAVKRRD